MAFDIQQHIELTQVETRQDTALGIMRWGRNNAFPQTLKNLIEQSANAKPVVQRMATFLKGEGFEGEDQIINAYGLTLKRAVSILADDYSIFRAFAIQVNYNLNGRVVSINPMRIAELRFNEFDELNYASKIGYHRDFARNSTVQKTVNNSVTRGKIKWFDRFNPETALGQIESTEGGIGNYNGQISYFSEEGHSSYPVPPLQAPINYVLSDIENSILVRKESTTGFISTYLMKTSLDSESATLRAIEDAIESAQGARGSGKVITISGLPPEDLTAALLEEIGGGSSGKTIIEAAMLTYELDKGVISGAYLIPPALAGIDRNTGFSGEDLVDAYFVFNAVTQPGRGVIEAELNAILKRSVFDTKHIEIKKLSLDTEENNTLSKEAKQDKK